VLALEVHFVAAPERLQDAQALLEPRHAHAGRVHRHSPRVVVGPQPTGADADVEPSVAQEIERGELLGEHHRMAVVVAQHVGPDAKGAGGIGHRGQRDQRRKIARTEVVGRGDGGEAASLGGARPFDQLGARRHRVQLRGAPARATQRGARQPLTARRTVIPDLLHGEAPGAGTAVRPSGNGVIVTAPAVDGAQ
jgi:hypothetical protein